MSKLGSDITRELEDILRRLNLLPNDKFYILVDETFEEKEDNKLTDFLEFDEESRLLRKGSIPVFAYIRDMTTDGWWNRLNRDPKRILVNGREVMWKGKINRLHFTMCRTIRERENLDRFQITNRDDDKYPIDLPRDLSGIAKLDPCQNCLNELRYKRFHRGMQQENKDAIVRNFSAKEAMAYISDYDDEIAEFKETIKGLRRDFEFAGLPDNWRAISYSYRRSRGFVCENKRGVPPEAGCGVSLINFTHLTDCHHINGVKSQCDDDNLCCLCKECHEKLHPHYRQLSEEDRKTLRRLRAEQGIDEIVSTPNAL